MPHITTCTFCSTCYEETSEEAANHPGRMCRTCSDRILTPALYASGGDCVGCGRVMSVRERNEQGVCDACATGEGARNG